MSQYYIVKIESFEGKDTFLHCGGDEHGVLYCIILVKPGAEAEIIDNGYMSYEEAAEAWPEAAVGSQQS